MKSAQLKIGRTTLDVIYTADRGKGYEPHGEPVGTEVVVRLVELNGKRVRLSQRWQDEAEKVVCKCEGLR